MARFREYDEIPAISNSMLSHFKRSPEHYVYAVQHKKPPTPAMVFGTAFHSYVLEPHLFDTDVAVMDESKRPAPDKDYKTKINAEWKAEFLLNAATDKKEVITVDQFERIKVMADKLNNHELAGELLNISGLQKESKLQWKWKNTNCKGLCDMRHDQFLADLKTGVDVDPDVWQRNFFYWDYHRQGGMYLDGDADGKLSYANRYKDFFFIAIEPEPPHGIAVYKISKEVLSKGVEEYRTLVEQFQVCVDNNIWQGYEFKSIAGQMFDIHLPYYMRD